MEADSFCLPFCSSGIAYEYLAQCHRGFDGHLGRVKPEKVCFKCKSFIASEGVSAEARDFHTLRWTEAPGF